MHLTIGRAAERTPTATIGKIAINKRIRHFLTLDSVFI
jgi:hypothetical protein